MTNGADRMMEDALENAIAATAHPSTARGLCGEHDGLRQGVYALCLAEQSRGKSYASPCKSFRMGRIEMKGFDAADVVKILGMLLVVILLAGDKVSRYFVAEDLKAATTTSETINESQLAAMRSVAQSLIDETRKEMQERAKKQ